MAHTRGLEQDARLRDRQASLAILIATSLLAIAVSFIDARYALWSLSLNLAAPIVDRWRGGTATWQLYWQRYARLIQSSNPQLLQGANACLPASAIGKICNAGSAKSRASRGYNGPNHPARPARPRRCARRRNERPDHLTPPPKRSWTDLGVWTRAMSFRPALSGGVLRRKEHRARDRQSNRRATQRACPYSASPD
jgi:hypothetical protein